MPAKDKTRMGDCGSMTVHHLNFIAPGASPAEIRRFYGEALELIEIEKPMSLAGVSVLWFTAGAMVFHVGYPAAGTVGDGHTALATPSVEAARARFLELGYDVDDHVIPMGYPRFYVRDPWGNRFEILPVCLL
jgi:catechol 2,3-dioxygenase-like lactoylglutathione lyase family enzyme